MHVVLLPASARTGCAAVGAVTACTNNPTYVCKQLQDKCIVRLGECIHTCINIIDGLTCSNQQKQGIGVLGHVEQLYDMHAGAGARAGAGAGEVQVQGQGQGQGRVQGQGREEGQGQI